MESEKRLYSVLTRTEVRDKMMKEIVQISEVFSLSQSDATLTLIRLGWDSFRASDLLGDNKEKFLSKLGFVRVSDTDGDGDDNLVSTPLCSHKFCSDCWKDHLSESLENKTEMVTISSLNKDCVVSVGTDAIEKPSETVKEMYERYVLGSFMDSNKIKWCPASGCEYAIQRHDDQDGAAANDDDDVVDDEDEDEEETSDDDFGVVCLCGHTFCWKCKLESHSPVTCNNASLWLNQLLEEATTLSKFPKTTKPCPSCNTNVQKLSTDHFKIVTCSCSHAFCWRCLVSEEDHIGIVRCSKVHVPPPSNEVALLRHLTLWEESDKATEEAKRNLESIELNSKQILTSNPRLGEFDMRALREAFVLTVQCRLVLKWSCVFGYFLTDYNSGKKKYLDHLRGVATAYLLKHKENVDEVVRGAMSGGDVIGFRIKLETSTTRTGNYFHYFVKMVEDGLSDVKDGVFEDVATNYWFCDRCTFQNDSFERKCRVCVFPFEGPSPLVADKDNIIAVAQVPNLSSEGGANPFESAPPVAFGTSVHQQQVPNMMGNNPFAARPGGRFYVPMSSQGASTHYQPNMASNEGGANPFESAPPVAFGTSVHQQQVPNMMANNPFAARPEGRFYVPMSSRGASTHYRPNMASNGFGASREGPIFFRPPQVVAPYGDDSAHQQDPVPNMANLNPFAHPGGTYPLQSAPFVAFGNNNNGATPSAQQQKAPDMIQQQASNMPNNQAVAHVKEDPNLGVD